MLRECTFALEMSLSGPTECHLYKSRLFISAGNVASKLRQTSRYESSLQSAHFGVFSCFPIATMFMRCALSTESLRSVSTSNQLSIWPPYFKRCSDTEVLDTWGYHKDSKPFFFSMWNLANLHNSLFQITKGLLVKVWSTAQPSWVGQPRAKEVFVCCSLLKFSIKIDYQQKPVQVCLRTLPI